MHIQLCHQQFYCTQLSPAIESVAHGNKPMTMWGRMLMQNKQLCLIFYILIHFSSRINLFRIHPGNVLLKNCNGTSKLLGRMLQTVTPIDSSLHPAFSLVLSQLSLLTCELLYITTWGRILTQINHSIALMTENTSRCTKLVTKDLDTVVKVIFSLQCLT